MGILVDRATNSLILVVRVIAEEIKLAETVEALLGSELLAQSTERGFWVLQNFIKPDLHFIINGDVRNEDQTLLQNLRRALKVPYMTRQLTNLGTFEWAGTSDVTFDGKNLHVSLSAAKNGCVIKRIEEQVTRVRFESACNPEVATLTE